MLKFLRLNYGHQIYQGDWSLVKWDSPTEKSSSFLVGKRRYRHCFQEFQYLNSPVYYFKNKLLPFNSHQIQCIKNLFQSKVLWDINLYELNEKKLVIFFTAEGKEGTEVQNLFNAIFSYHELLPIDMTLCKMFCRINLLCR